MKSSIAPDTFGARLRAARKRSGLRLSDLAERIGVSTARVHQLESQTDPDPETVGRLALALGIDPSDLWPSVPLLGRWDGDAVIVGRDRIGSFKALRRLAGDRRVVIDPAELANFSRGS